MVKVFQVIVYCFEVVKAVGEVFEDMPIQGIGSSGQGLQGEDIPIQGLQGDEGLAGRGLYEIEFQGAQLSLKRGFFH